MQTATANCVEWGSQESDGCFIKYEVNENVMRPFSFQNYINLESKTLYTKTISNTKEGKGEGHLEESK